MSVRMFRLLHPPKTIRKSDPFGQREIDRHVKVILWGAVCLAFVVVLACFA